MTSHAPCFLCYILVVLQNGMWNETLWLAFGYGGPFAGKGVGCDVLFVYEFAFVKAVFLLYLGIV